jgi:hypothetical protein
MACNVEREFSGLLNSRNRSITFLCVYLFYTFVFIYDAYLRVLYIIRIVFSLCKNNKFDNLTHTHKKKLNYDCNEMWARITLCSKLNSKIETNKKCLWKIRKEKNKRMLIHVLNARGTRAIVHLSVKCKINILGILKTNLKQKKKNRIKT